MCRGLSADDEQTAAGAEPVQKRRRHFRDGAGDRDGVELLARIEGQRIGLLVTDVVQIECGQTLFGIGNEIGMQVNGDQ